MKKLFAWVLVLACLLLTGCGQFWEDMGRIGSDVKNMMTEPVETEPPVVTEPPTQPPRTVELPKVLVSRSDFFAEEQYEPRIEFHPDGTCGLRLNIAEYMVDITGTYRVAEDAKDGPLVLCSYDSMEVDGRERKLDAFILAQQTPGVWTFLGEGLGLTWTGSLFYPAGEETLTVEPESPPEGQPALGRYISGKGDTDSLEITRAEGNVLEFSAHWDRRDAMTGVTAYRFDNYAFFWYCREAEGEQEGWTSGVAALLENGAVELTVHRTELQHVLPGSYTFHPAE